MIFDYTRGRKADWADFDRDSDMDILMVYERDSGRFKPVLIQNMTDIVKSRMPWGDFNNDGYLDFMANEPKPDNTASVLKLSF